MRPKGQHNGLMPPERGSSRYPSIGSVRIIYGPFLPGLEVLTFSYCMFQQPFWKNTSISMGLFYRCPKCFLATFPRCPILRAGAWVVIDVSEGHWPTPRGLFTVNSWAGCVFRSAPCVALSKPAPTCCEVPSKCPESGRSSWAHP